MITHTIRPTLSVVAYIAAFFGAPWLVILCAGALSIRWRAWEVIILGLMIDFVYAPTLGISHIPFVATLISLTIVWGLEPFRDRLYT